MTGSLATTLGVRNPFRYRGYYYDAETSLYYVKSRYYEPEIGRWISADSLDIFAKNIVGILNKNLYAYCDNNPVIRKDVCGDFWETALDVISLGASIVEVAINPTDIWAWASLGGDVVDLIPFITGIGETTRAIKTIRKTVDTSDDVIDVAKSLRTVDGIKGLEGSYEILYKSGNNYVGKGGFSRAVESAVRYSDKDDVMSIMWKSAPDRREAFIDEYWMQRRSAYTPNKGMKGTYNKIWSPGKRYNEFKGSIIFFVGLTLPRYRFSKTSASLDMNLRQCVG